MSSSLAAWPLRRTRRAGVRQLGPRHAVPPHPPAKPWLAAHSHAQGLSIARIAHKLRISDVSVRTYLRREPRTTARRRRTPKITPPCPQSSAIGYSQLMPRKTGSDLLTPVLTHDSGGGRAPATASAAGSALPVESASLSHAQPCHGDAAQRYAFHLVSAHSSAGRPSSVNGCQTCASAY